MENRDAERPPPTGGGAQLAPLFKICVFLRPTGRCAGGESGRLRQTPIGGLLNDRAEGHPLEHTRENEARCDQSADQQKFSFEGHVGAFDELNGMTALSALAGIAIDAVWKFVVSSRVVWTPR